ncbi:MAG: sigma-54-dependent Fis family transcriptional regulator [Paludibacteraceae bacterium]|nr:sigma-54-dependent Fis family transcriptional regulator [Paludibacteraceae bacterium]MBO7259246.1 sigma-54-dependent Fis family transcriptional regulator [Paludibacteraceae bacterium]
MNELGLQTVKQKFGIIGTSPALHRALDVAVQVAPTDLSVLITGESGVGKEVFPQVIHAYSLRKHGPYFAINCGAIPEGTIDSELFGHEKGSFTGANTERKGYFEVADGGTLFLDEVGELPLSTQARLLRVLETGEFIRVGASKVQKTNVRVVAATNVDVMQAVSEGRFREDLYYRLNTVPISVPALRDRKQDIPLLFRKFAADISEKYRMPPLRLTDEARAMLCNYYWNGNVRQLKNVTEQISIIEQNREITPDILRHYLPENEMGRTPMLWQRNNTKGKTFNSEREILYEVLFDMKKDVNDLKKLVHNIINQNNISPEDMQLIKQYSEETTPYATPVRTLQQVNTSAKNEEHDSLAHIVDDLDYQEAVEYNENADIQVQGNTLQEVEKEMIRRTLIENKGKRNATAAALNISERTLYRKLKEYDLFEPKKKTNK